MTKSSPLAAACAAAAAIAGPAAADLPLEEIVRVLPGDREAARGETPMSTRCRDGVWLDPFGRPAPLPIVMPDADHLFWTRAHAADASGRRRCGGVPARASA